MTYKNIKNKEKISYTYAHKYLYLNMANIYQIYMQWLLNYNSDDENNRF